jgi:hypothetical protein
MIFYQAQIEMHNLQDSMNQLRGQMRIISSLQNEFISTTYVQTIILCAYELLSKYTEVECAAL